MKTKYPMPGLSQFFYVIGILCFIPAPFLLIAFVASFTNYNGADPVLFGFAIGLTVMGLMYWALSAIIHRVFDFLYRSTEANEAMLELLAEQNRILSARENAPAVLPPVIVSPTTIALTTPPVKQAADELKSTCRHCSTRISFPREYDGQEAACPTCGNAVLLAAN